MAGLAAAVLITSPAAAGETDNLYSAEACKSPGVSKFKFHIWYNSGQNGSYRNIGYSIYDFNDAPDGVVGAHSALTFCVKNGASAPWPGSGLKVKNNGAAGENEHHKYKARVYVNSGYKGAQDVMAPYQHIDRFRHVYNNNASFKWSSK
ncbi:hypothetical protein [Streptomyces aureocirculatus]|uniref:hypothetical protein n=1 Tax=Streptomyces aureocirculatus TaxID=67275 RepID=UPI000689D314|nr:hypothetical protein [Streptomyces aureocirculatus]